MAWKLLLPACALALIGSVARAAIVEHTFKVGNTSTRKLCKQSVNVTVVNGRLPGPIVRAHDGDTVIVHVLNNSPYNITIHWHGIFQLLSGWADGPNYITQCPIIPGGSYTYRFNITGQEGTLWWHAHVSFLRATVYGALIIKPRAGTKAYPFAKLPYKEVPILLGEWWDANVLDVANEAPPTGGAPNISDAFTINGRPGDLYPCSSEKTYKLQVVRGETYMLRIINAALNHQLFFKVAGHSMTVVAVDASYTTPYSTDVVAIAPGQTVDALMKADAPPGGRYYMAARAYTSANNIAFDNTTATAIVRYTAQSNSNSPPVMPSMPAFNDTPTANAFYTSLTGLLLDGRHPVVPLHVDEHMFVTFGLGLVPCGRNQPRCRGQALAASMNNVSFQFPTQISLLEASFNSNGVAEGTPDVYTRDFPDRPPLVFDYTNTTGRLTSAAAMLALATTAKGTKVKRVKFNSTVEMVLQNTALLGVENHPLHLHGFNFFVLAQGLGNFNYKYNVNYNLVNPQVRNTIAVPAGGWAVIRFKADNPGVWIMHCHLDVHLPWGLATAFEVEDGPTPASTLPPPPPDFPRC